MKAKNIVSFLTFFVMLCGVTAPAQADWLQTYVGTTCDETSGRAMVRFGYADADDPPKFDHVSKDVDGGLSFLPVSNVSQVESSCSVSKDRIVRVHYFPGNNAGDTLAEWTVWINKVKIADGDANNAIPFAVIVEKAGYRLCTFKLAEDQWIYDLTTSVEPNESRPTPIKCDVAPTPFVKQYSSVEIRSIRSSLIEAEQALNDAYKAKISRLSLERSAALRQQQRGWLHARNASCGVSARESSQDLGTAIADNPVKMTCVSQFSRARTSELASPYEEPTPLFFAPNQAPICKLIESELNVTSGSHFDWNDWHFNDLTWKSVSEESQISPKKVSAKPRESQLDKLRVEGESDFDFFNDGKTERVMRSAFEDHYMTTNTLMVLPLSDQTGSSSSLLGSINEATAWFLPCQLESLQYPISECPPLTQNHDEAGLSLASTSGEAVRFRGRYVFLTAIRVKGASYVTIDGGAGGSLGYTAILKPKPDRAFDALCLFKH